MSTVISEALMSPDCSNPPDDIFNHSPMKAAALIKAHLTWQCNEQSNFMSWTSSLLFALQFGLYRYETDYDNPDFSEIFLYILDTSGFPEGTFIKDLDILDAFKEESLDLQRFLKLRRGNFKKRYYFGEYLTQGRLEIEGNCARVSLQQMMDLGLFELHPGLKNKNRWISLANRVLELRTNFKYLPSTTHSEIQKTIKIAQCCFGDRWVVPFAAMLLALRPRSHQDHDKIAEAYWEMFTGKLLIRCGYCLVANNVF